MPEVLAAPPVLTPPAGLLPGTGSSAARGAGFSAALRGSLQDSAPSDGDPPPERDAAAPADTGTVPWPLLLTVSTVSVGGAAQPPSSPGTPGSRAGAAGAQMGDLGNAGATPPAGEGSPVPTGVAALPHAGTPVTPGAPGPDARRPVEAAGGTRHPALPWGEGVAGTAPASAEAGAPLPLQQGFEGQPPAGPAPPGHPVPLAGAGAAAGGDPAPAALVPTRGGGEGLTERGTAADTSRPAAAPPHMSAGPGTGQEPPPAAALLAPNPTGDEDGGERRAAGGESSAAMPPPLASASIAYGGPDGADAAAPAEAGAAVRAATPAGVAPADAPRTPVVAQVAAALALSARDGAAEVTITLRPPELGEVHARIIAAPDGLVIRLSAEREAVGALLRARAGELHQALLVQQVPVAEVHVLHNPPPTPPATAPDWQGWQERLWLRREPGQQERRPGGDGTGQEADDEA